MAQPDNHAAPTRSRRLRNAWRRIPAPGRLLLITLVTVALLWALRPAAPERPVEDPQPRVNFETARPGSFHPELRLYGRVESHATATLTASATGNIRATPVLSGRTVEKGQLLVAMDPTEAQLLLDQREAELAEAKAQLESAELRHRNDRENLELEEQLVEIARQRQQRLERLRRDDMASQSQLDEAREGLARARLTLNSRELAVLDHDQEMQRLEARLRRARAARDQAALDRDRTEVTAPFAGRISSIHVAPGERIRPGEPLVTLYDHEGLEVRAQIPSRSLAPVRRGLRDEGHLSARAELEGEELELRLERLAGEVTAGRGGVDGLLRIQSGHRPEPGRTMDLSLKLPMEQDLIALPATALYGLDRIYRIDADNRLQALRVRRAGEWLDPDGRRRLLFHSEALEAGDRLLTMQLPGAIDGLAVAPRQQGATPVPRSRSSNAENNAADKPVTSDTDE